MFNRVHGKLPYLSPLIYYLDFECTYLVEMSNLKKIYWMFEYVVCRMHMYMFIYILLRINIVALIELFEYQNKRPRVVEQHMD